MAVSHEGTAAAIDALPASETIALWDHLFGAASGVLALFSGKRVDGRRDLESVKEKFVDYPADRDGAIRWLDAHAKAGRETYFCAHLLRQDADGVVKRQKPYAAPVTALWSDSDKGVIPDACPPTLILESSAGHHHSFWRLSRAIEPSAAEALNKRIATLCDVKNDGADLTQLLRPAGYPNYKHAGAPFTKLLTTRDAAYDPDELDRILPPLAESDRRNGHSAAPIPERIGEGARNETLTSIAGTLRRRELDQAAIRAALLGINAAQCDPPLGDDEVTGIAASVSRYEPETAPEFSFTFDQEQAAQQAPIAVPDFPVYGLPDAALLLVEEGAASLECPPELIGVPLLALTAGVIGNTQRIQLKPGYTQRAILWTAVIADPGTAKSPAQAIIQECVEVLQREAYERHRAALAEHEDAVSAWESADKTARGPKPAAPPQLAHYFTTDSTTEAIAKMLGGPGACTPGFTMNRDELSGWERSFDQYRAGGDRQIWLSLWAGMPLKSDRAGRDSIYVPNPAVSVRGGIQPDLLPSLAPPKGQRDGFVERLLYAYPETGPMPWSEATVSAAARAALCDAFRALRRAAPGTVHLAKDARAAYVSWFGANVRLQETVGGMMRGYYAKLPNQLARLALVFHCLTYPEAPGAELLGAETMEAAIALVEYFRLHSHKALAAFGAQTAVARPLATRVLRLLESEDGWVSLTALRTRLGGHTRAEELHEALAELARVGLATSRTTPSGPQGGRPATEWRRTPRRASDERNADPDGDHHDEGALRRNGEAGETGDDGPEVSAVVSTFVGEGVVVEHDSTPGAPTVPPGTPGVSAVSTFVRERDATSGDDAAPDAPTDGAMRQGVSTVSPFPRVDGHEKSEEATDDGDARVVLRNAETVETSVEGPEVSTACAFPRESNAVEQETAVPEALTGAPGAAEVSANSASLTEGVLAKNHEDDGSHSGLPVRGNVETAETSSSPPPPPLGRPLHPRPTATSVLALAERLDFPAVDVSPGVRTAAGADSWRAWTARASSGALVTMSMLHQAQLRDQP